MADGKMDVKRLFLGLQKQLALKLETDRDLLGHPSTLGDAAELNWIAMFQDYLPARYNAEKAFVLDAEGEISEQMDVVIFDRQYCPLLFNQDGAKYIPAESVYAVFEVKQTMDRRYIGYAGEKAASVRRLKRTSAPIPHAGGTYAPKPHGPILAGLLTLESEWKPALGTPLTTALCALPEEQRLDLGCCLRHGAFEMLYPEGDAPQPEFSEEDTALVFFFLRLLQRLQQLGTVPAIDLREYSKAL